MGFTLKKLKLGGDPPCTCIPKKNFKDQTEEGNNPDQYQFHFCWIICIEINRDDFFLTDCLMSYLYCYSFYATFSSKSNCLSLIFHIKYLILILHIKNHVILKNILQICIQSYVFKVLINIQLFFQYVSFFSENTICFQLNNKIMIYNELQKIYLKPCAEKYKCCV